jgi:hypothetical protein
MGQPAKSDSGRRKLFNWLKDFDKRASKLPPAEGMWTYSLFLFARYPRLRPRPIRAKRLDEALHKAGYESLAQLLSGRERQIAEHEETRRAIRGLKSAQRIQLAALLVDTAADIENFTGRRDAKDRSFKLEREGPRRQRMLARKLEASRRSLDNLRRYASALDASMGSSYRKAAEDALTRLSGLPTNRSFQGILTVYRELRQVTENPTTFAMVQLYWFFRSGCGLSGHEAEVRVALVRNAFWAAFSVAPVTFFPEYQVGQPRGCQAVHEAVRRFCPKKGTPS